MVGSHSSTIRLGVGVGGGPVVAVVGNPRGCHTFGNLRGLVVQAQTTASARVARGLRLVVPHGSVGALKHARSQCAPLTMVSPSTLILSHERTLFMYHPLTKEDVESGRDR